MLYVLLYFLSVVLTWIIIALIDDNLSNDKIPKEICAILLFLAPIGLILIILIGIAALLSRIDWLFQPSFKYFKRKKL